MRPILVLNGPNLNLLGRREPQIYGVTSYQELVAQLSALGPSLQLEVRCAQSNHEGALIDMIHEAMGWAAGLVINPAAYGHTSLALRDAVVACGLPTVEVHISNIAAREPFRQRSYLSEVSVGILSGFGVYGYQLALMAIAQHLSQAEGQA